MAWWGDPFGPFPFVYPTRAKGKQEKVEENVEERIRTGELCHRPAPPQGESPNPYVRESS